MTKSDKEGLVQEMVELVGEKYQELIYKHDGCRVLQAMLKFGSKDQRSKIVNEIKGSFVFLMTNKYSRHLAAKAYQFT